ncbi:MAG: site-specific integrase [Gammaproteobacteria bacterium]
MRQKLTTTSIKQVSPTEKPFEIVDSELRGFLLRVQPTGRMTFYFSYRNEAGKKARIKIGTVGNISPQQARDQATALAGQVSTGVDVQAEKKHKKAVSELEKQSSLGHFIENQYKPWALSNRKSGQSTLDALHRHFKDWSTLQMDEISPYLVEQWRTRQLKAGMQPSTVNRNVACLKGVLSKALEWDSLEHHPLEKLKPLKIDSSPKVRFLTSSEEQSLSLALRKRDNELKLARERGNQFREKRGYEPLPSLMELDFADYLEPMVIVSLKTGMRRGEVFDLLWSDINFETETVTIRAEISKSNKTRHIPLSPIALDTLKKWKQQQPGSPDSTRVFTNSKGERFDNTNKAWRAILKDAGISDFRWHDMRHDFASKLVMKGVPLNTVRELCGHSDMNTTLRYAHLAPEHKAEAIALLG